MAKRRRRDRASLPAALLLLALCAAAGLLAGWGARSVGRKGAELEYGALIAAQAEANGLEESLLRAVVYCESRYRADAVSSIGARGLMQLTGETFEWVRWRLDEEDKTTFDDAFDPETNVRYGAYLLRWLLDRFENEATAIAAYHAGANVVGRWLEDPRYSADGKTLDTIPYADTAGYVASVLQAKERYETLSHTERSH